MQALLDAVPDKSRRRDCLALLEIMGEITGCEPKIWSAGIVGFGEYHYRYESGREGDWFLTGFSPRKNALTIYVVAGFERYGEIMARLGKYTTGKSCLYVKKLAHVDADTLTELIATSVQQVKRSYPG